MKTSIIWWLGGFFLGLAVMAFITSKENRDLMNQVRSEHALYQGMKFERDAARQTADAFESAAKQYALLSEQSREVAHSNYTMANICIFHYDRLKVNYEKLKKLESQEPIYGWVQ